MFVDWLLACFHHLAVFSLAAILSAEIFLTAGPIDGRLALRLARVDAWAGFLAVDRKCGFRRGFDARVLGLRRLKTKSAALAAALERLSL